MKKNIFRNKDYAAELVELIRRTGDRQRLPELLSDYHDKDIAEAVTACRRTSAASCTGSSARSGCPRFFPISTTQSRISTSCRWSWPAKVVSGMDADDAVDVLDDLSGDKKPGSGRAARQRRADRCAAPSSPTARTRSAAA